LLVIAPVGAYIGRVQSGIDRILSQNASPSTRVVVVLVVGSDWIAMDNAYKSSFVEPVRNHLLKTWQQEKFQIECQVRELPLDEEDYVAGWLLGTISDFLSSNPKDSPVHVDLTSGPKEWQFAAIDVSHFFSNLELYFVKSTIKRRPSDFPEEQIREQGHPKLQIVRTGQSTLRHWLEPADEKYGQPNQPYVLFKAVLEFALAKTPRSTQDAEELTRILVPVEADDFIRHYRELLPSELESRLRDDSDLKRSISKLLSSVEMFKLFEREGRSVRLTIKGAMLGLSLFAKRRSNSAK